MREMATRFIILRSWRVQKTSSTLIGKSTCSLGKTWFEPRDRRLLIYDAPFGKSGLQICYEIAFPVMAKINPVIVAPNGEILTKAATGKEEIRMAEVNRIDTINDYNYLLADRRTDIYDEYLMQNLGIFIPSSGRHRRCFSASQCENQDDAAQLKCLLEKHFEKFP